MRRRGNDLRRIPKKSLSTQTRDYAYIQELVATDDGRGGETRVWTNTSAKPHSMGIFPIMAGQVYEYRTENVEATHLIKIRGEIEVTELNRVVEGATIYEILAAENIQNRGIVTWLTCKERRA